VNASSAWRDSSGEKYRSAEESGKMLTREDAKRLLLWDALGALGVGAIASFFSRDYVYSMAMGFAMVYMIEAFYFLNRRLLTPRIEDLPRVRRVLVEIGASFVSHLLGGILGALLVTLLLQRYAPVMLLYLVTFSLFFPAIHSVQYVRMFHRELRETELQEERLKALAAEAELKALKAQINPHFLFNTLNTVAHLIRTDPPRAEKTVEKLAEVFRYALVAVDKDVVPLADEFSFMDDYLTLEHERFGERLLVKSNVAPDSLQILVPPLILQPLVENALRHGRNPQGEVRLTLETYLNEQSLVISISDQGPGFPTHTTWRESSGIGLRNVRERLEKKYGQGFGLQLAENEPNGAKIIITIPKEQP
jgi:signal transduction histidine kinase